MLLAFALSAPLALASCAEPDASSLCPRYDELLVVLATLPADPSAATAGEAADAVEDLRATADQLAAADDGRHADTMLQLTTALDDLERTLRSIEPDADAGTWQPIVDDSTAEVADALTALDDALAQECADDA